MTDIISDDARDRREAARNRGRFGEQEHSTPEAEIITPTPPPHELRIRQLLDERLAAQKKLDELDDSIRGELVRAVWKDLPPEAAVIEFHAYQQDRDTEVFSFLSVQDAAGSDISSVYYDQGSDMASCFDRDSAAEFMDENAEGDVFSIDVGKDATRERIRTLHEEWKSGSHGRSGKDIGDDIDAAATRYLRQVAADQNWESLELDWEDEGRTGLCAVSITAAGKRHPAGSGALDDHEALWAASQFATPTSEMARTNSVAPFTLSFES